MYEEITNILKNGKFKKWIYPYHWLSGSSTYVPPIAFWDDRKEIVIQLSKAKDYSKRGRDRAIHLAMKPIFEKFGDDIKGWYVSDHHGDCPDTLNILFN